MEERILSFVGLIRLFFKGRSDCCLVPKTQDRWESICLEIDLFLDGPLEIIQQAKSVEMKKKS